VAFDAFLKLGDIKGGSTDAAHKDDIELQSYSFGVSNTVSPGGPTGTGAGAGKASFSDLSFVMRMGAASPLIMFACASGQHFPEAKLVLRRSGGKSSLEFCTVTMREVFVSAYQDGGAPGDDGPLDSVNLAFGAVKVDYVTQNPSGTAGPITSGGWDRTKNKKFEG
jgi:type VI secretion system secreted protein Hcp